MAGSLNFRDIVQNAQKATGEAAVASSSGASSSEASSSGASSSGASSSGGIEIENQSAQYIQGSAKSGFLG